MLKLNKFDKFLWKHQRAILTTTWIVAILPMLIMNVIDFDMFLPYLAIIVLEFLVFVIAILEIIVSSKIRTFAKVHNYQLNMQAFLDGTKLLIEATNPKNKTQLAVNSYNLITTYFTMGDYDRAENEINLFLQHFGDNKDVSLKIKIYAKMAQIALIKGNYEIYNEYIRRIHTLLESVRGLKMVINMLNYDYMNLMLWVDAFTCGENINEVGYEAKVFEVLNTSQFTGKPRKKEIMPIEYISAYYRLFLFFKNKKNTEKATFYANLLMTFGNAQLIAYREAKEYLENENRSN